MFYSIESIYSEQKYAHICLFVIHNSGRVRKSREKMK